MVQGICRLWNLSIAAVTILSIYNILLTLKSMYSPEECSRKFIQVQSPAISPKQPCSEHLHIDSSNPPFASFDLRLGHWDNRHQYKYFDNIQIGERFTDLSDEFTVCLATQSSIEKIHSVFQVASHWSGPMSMAVFAAGDELNLVLLYITYLRQCFVEIRDRVNFHLAVPKDRIPTSIQLDISYLDQMDCSKPDITLQQLLKKRTSATSKWRLKNPYPQNHMRNLARKNCQSNFVFLTDVDIIPSIRLAEELDKFLRKVTCKGRCAYVIPTYELDERVRFPPNKTELVRLANKGLARPFHHKVFIYNQFATNFSRWQNNTGESPDVHISHPVTNFEFLYEPFYVAPDTVPPHDERFVGYGYTRNTQVYEMFVAGYEFLVLSPIFTCHWGLQVKRSRPHWREHQNNFNRKRFETFKKEIFAKYNKDPLNMMAQRNKVLNLHSNN